MSEVRTLSPLVILQRTESTSSPSNPSVNFLDATQLTHSFKSITNH